MGEFWTTSRRQNDGRGRGTGSWIDFFLHGEPWTSDSLWEKLGYDEDALMSRQIAQPHQFPSPIGL